MSIAFSHRLPDNTNANALSERLAAMRAAGSPVVDLTESNPTRAGVVYPADLLAALSEPGSLVYEPHPLGLETARAAVARDCERRQAGVDASRIVLTASTSESYSWLFKLLCNPGDRVLVPRPSYPLFEHLTRLDGVRADAYDLDYHGRWAIDFHSLESATTPSTKAVLVVTPNNPTGSFLTRTEHERLSRWCDARGLALIVDEVFVDYPLCPRGSEWLTDVAAHSETLTFTLGGVSKSIGLPQMKLGWIVVGGAPPMRRAALDALELIADSYLSVSTPVQLAAASLLEQGAAVRGQIHDRVIRNLRALEHAIAQFPACTLLRAEGGWSAVVRVPSVRSEEDLVIGLLADEGILVHPGFFFDFPHEAFIVVSLLPSPEVFDAAMPRALRYATA